MYDFATNSVKLQRAIQAVGQDYDAVLAEYIRIGGKVSENYSSEKNKKKQHAESNNKPSNKTDTVSEVKQEQQEQGFESALAKLTRGTAKRSDTNVE